MDGISCDRCGVSLLVESDVRYVVNLEAYAAYDPLEITSGELERDFDAEYRALIDRIEVTSADELEEQVYVRRSYDLCPACHGTFLKDPIQKASLDQQ